MKKWNYVLVTAFCLSSLAACDSNRPVENADEQTSPGVTAGGTGAGTTATGVGTTGTPGNLTDVGDTIRTEENQRQPNP